MLWIHFIQDFQYFSWRVQHRICYYQCVWTVISIHNMTWMWWVSSVRSDSKQNPSSTTILSASGTIDSLSRLNLLFPFDYFYPSFGSQSVWQNVCSLNNVLVHSLKIGNNISKGQVKMFTWTIPEITLVQVNETFPFGICRELMSQHPSNLRTLLTHTIYNELSQSRNPNNMSLLTVMFQYSSDHSARVCRLQSILCWFSWILTVAYFGMRSGCN